MTTKHLYHYSLEYKGSKIIAFLILLLALFFNAALFIFAFLAMKNLKISTIDKTIYLKYKGSYIWLFVWAFIFIPISIILLFVNGITVVKEFRHSMSINKKITKKK